MDDDIESVLSGVGPRLRAVREQRHATLADVAAVTGISISTLSRLESGRRKPTLEMLLPLAREYAVPIDELVGAPATGDPRIHLRPVKRHGQTHIPLSRRPGGSQAWKIVLPPGQPNAVPDPRTHAGFDWLYVLSGRLRLVLGDRDMVLAPGEAAEFDTRVPHWFASADPQPTEVLSLFGTQGERAHLKVRA